MFIEKKMVDALIDFKNGLEVVVMCKFDDGSIMCEELKNMFAENARFLVDVPENKQPKQPVIPVVKDKPKPEQEEPAKEPQKSKNCCSGKSHSCKRNGNRNFRNYDLQSGCSYRAHQRSKLL